MNRNQLKYLAALAMLFDHLGAIFISIRTPFGLFCRVFGRLTAPIMCYFLAEGFRHTSDKKRYLLRLFLFALIAQPAYSLAFHHVVWGWDLNMLFTLFLAVLMLCAYEGVRRPWLRWLCVLGLIAASYKSDWMLIGPIWVLVFYLTRGDRGRQLLGFAAGCLCFTAWFIWRDAARGYNWHWELVQLGTLLAIPLLAAYNGEKGRGGAFSKWFFYVLYPAHLYVYAWVARGN